MEDEKFNVADYPTRVMQVIQDLPEEFRAGMGLGLISCAVVDLVIEFNKLNKNIQDLVDVIKGK